MKLIYTLAELKELPEDELLDIMYFDAGDTTFSYNDIKHTNDKTLVIVLNSGTKIECTTKEIFRSVIQKKLRYDLTQATLAGLRHQTALQESFKAEIESTVKSQIDVLKTSFYDAKTEAMENLNSTNSSMTTAIKNFEVKTQNIHTQYKDKLSELDIENYKVKISKLDKILTAFDTLLQE